MKNYPSNLSYIMDFLKVSGKEISRNISVDDSLISKWKNNQRLLTIETSHLYPLVNFFLNYKKGVFEKNLILLFQEVYPHETIQSKNKLQELLLYFLTTPYAPKKYEPINNLMPSEYSSNMFSFLQFLGNQGRREAVLIFFDHVLQSKDPQELFLISQEDMTWLTEDLNFLNLWKDTLKRILCSGHRINIIHWVDRSTKNLGEIIINWIPLYLTGNISSCYLPRYSELTFKFTLFMVKNKVALIGMEGNHQNNRYSSIYKDHFTLDHFSSMYENIARNCKTLVEIFDVGKKEERKRLFSKVPPPSSETIHVANIPGFHTIPLDLFKEILLSNPIEKDTYEKCLILHEKMKIFTASKKRKEIYCKESLKKALSEDTYLYWDLLLLTGQEIRASKEQFLAHLKNILENALLDPNYEVGLNDDTFEIDIFLSIEEYVFAWKPALSPYLSLLTESNVVEAFHYDYQTLWLNIPTVNKDPEIIIERMSHFT